ncbi:MAG: fused MFS/spermidine synthase [Candidatus Erginobacter occultus]|nr:fused MFS/spermidine synthase [Candidatus Erginobacter occultus]
MSRSFSNRALPLFLAVFLAGFSALSAQIVFLRELLVFFYGNELSLGVVLGCWLFWTGLGSLGLGRISDRLRNPALVFSLVQTLLAFVLVLTLPAIRAGRLLLDLAPGQIAGYGPIFLVSFSALSLTCLLNGFLFSLGCRSYDRIAPGPSGDPALRPARGLGMVYIMEALGSTAGGLLTSFLLIRTLDSLPLLLLLGGLNLAAAGVLLLSGPVRRRGRFWKFPWLAAAAAAVAALILGWAGDLDRMSRNWQWRGFRLEQVENSIYGNLVVTVRENQFSVFENGLLIFTYPDESTVEESVHFALLQHPRPRRVLMIGGGAGGGLREILRHPSVEEVIYLELDPAIVRLAGQFLPPEERRFLSDPRVEIVHRDGRLYLQRREARYDLIILNLPDPLNAQINRFYTREFFSLARTRLRKGGVLGFGVTSSPNYVSGELRNFLGTLSRTVGEAFPELVIVPGGANYFLASDSPDYLTDDYRLLEKRVRERGLDLRYVRGYYLADRMSRERVDYLRKQIETAPRTRINRDFHPISYFYNVVFWSSYFAGETGGWVIRLLQGALVIRWWWFALPAALALLAFPLFRHRSRRTRGGWVLGPVFTSGFSEIVFQVVVLLAFQIFYGYVYYKLGLLLTLFMVGLALGAGTVTALLPRVRNDYRLLLATQVAICLYPLILPAVFAFLSAARGTPAVFGVGEHLVFPLLPLAAGFVGGFQLPLAGKIYLKRRPKVGLVAGLTYGADILGACVGAVAVSALILPILGVYATCYAVALVNLASLIVILGYRPRQTRAPGPGAN